MAVFLRLSLSCLVWFALCASTNAQVTVTKRDSLIHDANNNMAANPGDSLRYKTKVKNTSGGTVDADAFDVSASGNLGAPANIRTTPVAVDDAYSVTGNVGIMVDSMSGLKINDFDDDYEGATILPEMKMTAQGGNVTINDDGSFTYIPQSGYTGLDTFTYTLLDGNPLPECPDENDGTVILTIADMIIFIDNSSVAATSDGRLTSPFKSLADFNSGSPAASPVVYVENTGTNYTGGIVLQDNERLFGEGHTGGANLANVLPFVLAPHSLMLPNINGTRPVITNTAGDGVTLAMHNTLRGFNVGNCSDYGIENSGTNSVGNLVVSEVSVNNGTGGGFDASHGSGASTNVVFTSLSSTGGTNGINLTNCAGTFTVNGGTVTNPTGTGVLISGGSVVFSSSGAITDNTGFAVDIDNHDSGNATFSGNITSTGAGVRVQNCGGGTKLFSGNSKSLTTTTNNGVTLSSNTSAVINFTNGGLVINTTSGIGFNATGGGTVNVTGSGNTINSGTGTALNVANTTFGSGNMNFQSISANSGANGIVLNTTGSSGGLVVTGTGMTAGSGGTIQSTTSHSLNLNSTQAVSLSYLNVSGSGAHGINGSGVNGLTLTGCQITNSGNADNEYGMNLFNCTGTLQVNGTTFNNAADNLVYISSTSGTLTANFQNSSAFSYPMSVSGTANSAILVEPGNAAVINTTIQNCTFTNIVSASAQFGYNVAASSGTSNFNFSNNTIVVNLPMRGSGVTISGQENSTTNITIDNNNFSGAGGNGVITIDVNDNSRVTGTASVNTISNPPGIGMFIAVDENANADVTLNNNIIANSGGDGIQSVNFGGVGVSDMRLYITNNTINGHSLNTAVNFVGGISFTGFEDNSCIDIRGNVVTGTPVGATHCGGLPCVDYYVEEVGGVTTFQEIPNTGDVSLNAVYLNSINDAGPVTIFGVIDLTNGVICPIP